MEAKIKQNSLNLAKTSQKPLTFWLRCAKLILEYIGIVVYYLTNTVGKLTAIFTSLNIGGVVYFDGQNILYRLGRQEDHPDKKQKQTGKLTIASLGMVGRQLYLGFPNTFCFLSKRFFVEKNARLPFRLRSGFGDGQNKNKKVHLYDCRLLSPPRHIARGRSQQNYRDSLGAAGTNSPSPEGFSRLALLYQRTSRADRAIGSPDQLFSQCRQFVRLERVISLLSFLIFRISLQYVWYQNQNFEFIKVRPADKDLFF